LKEWQDNDLLERVHPTIAKKHPGYDAINRLIKVRDDLFMAGFRPRLATPMLLAILSRLKDRELSHTLSKLGYRAAEIEGIENFPEKALEIQKELAGKKTKTPIEAYRYIEKIPMEFVAYLLAESNNSAAISKLKSYLQKWRPVRQALPIVGTELEAIGMPRGPKFDQIVQDVFAIQLNGRAKTPEERVKILRKLSGIKEAPKKKEKEKKPVKAEKHVETAAEKKSAAEAHHAAREKHKAGMKAAAAKHKPRK
jgi:hypothetical protein